MDESGLKRLFAAFRKNTSSKPIQDMANHCGIDTIFHQEESLNLSLVKNVLLKNRQKVMLIELKKLFDAAEKEALEIVLLKGVAEAFDLYKEPFARPSGDIDLLIRPEDAVKFSLLCRDLGYLYGDGEITADLIEKDISYRSHHHLQKFTKPDRMFPISLELHMVLDATWYTIQTNTGINLTEAVFTNKQLFNIDEIRIYVCDPYDRFIFALQHSARHTYDCMNTVWYYTKNTSVALDLKTLVDGILLSEKYPVVLENDILYKRIENYGFAEDILFANKMAIEIFDFPLLSEEKLKKLQPYQCNYWKDQIYRCLCSIHPFNNFISLPLPDIYKSLVKKCLESNERYTCKTTKTTEFITIDDSCDTLTKRRFGTVCRFGLVPKKENHYQAKINMVHDAEVLSIVFDIEDAIVQVGGFDRQNAWAESICLIFYNPNCISDNSNITTGLFFSPSVDEQGKVSVQVEYIGEWRDPRQTTDFPLEEQNASFALTNSGYTLSLKLAWEKLGIQYESLSYLGMDFVLNNVDTNEPALTSVLSWSNPIFDFYNPSTLGMVFFEKESSP